MELRGARVLVTGASRGIGEAVARELARRGAVVAGVARNAEALDRLDGDTGGTSHPADLTDPDQVEGLVERVEREAGPIDVLVNNAGIETGGNVTTKTDGELRQIVQLNLTTPMQLCRQALPGMIARGRGHVVNVSSMAGASAFPGMAPYAATKAGLSQFTRILRRELGGTGVGLTLVELGPVPTDMLDQVNDHAPARAGFHRGYKLRLIVDVPKETVARSIADAIAHDRGSVRLPKRGAAFPVLAATPQAIVDLITRGIPTR